MTTRPVDPHNNAKLADPVSTDVVRAAIIDMDGVVTDTAGVHAEAWRQMFDQALPALSGGAGAVMAFDPVHEYRRLVDGRAREDGVRAVLGARGLSLPDGNLRIRRPGVRSMGWRTANSSCSSGFWRRVAFGHFLRRSHC